MLKKHTGAAIFIRTGKSFVEEFHLSNSLELARKMYGGTCVALHHSQGNSLKAHHSYQVFNTTIVGRQIICHTGKESPATSLRRALQEFYFLEI